MTLDIKTGLNIGCGTDIRPNYINLDKVSLPGVDTVWDINQFPYPFDNDRFSTVLMINVLEHLPDTIKVIEEVHRLCKPGAIVTIRVPYWNSIEQATDPTHVRFFSELSMNYFDPATDLGRRRQYYSSATFCVQSIGAWIYVGNRYFLVKNKLLCTVLWSIAHHLSNVVRLIEFNLQARKP